MNNLLSSPTLQLLVKWTVMLALSWTVHWVLLHRHARWRLILWRSVLCFGCALPLLQLISIPGIRIAIPGRPAAALEASAVNPAATSDYASLAANSPPAVVHLSTVRASTGSGARTHPTVTSSCGWRTVAGIWLLGCLMATTRLLFLNLRLCRLRKWSMEPPAEISKLAAQIRHRLQVRQTVQVRISDHVVSPCVFGLVKPTILLPRKLVQQSSTLEMLALLGHEFAHLRDHDLFWCVAWRWMQVACWFHPLTWRIAAAHRLACEQEADRIASRQTTGSGTYAQMLARLTLRVLSLPAAETALALSGSSQIRRRLRHLERTETVSWNWKYSAAAFAIAGVVLALTAGCNVSQSDAARPVSAAPDPKIPKAEFATMTVEVQDDGGKPIAGATIRPTGFRVKGIHAADAYGWNRKLFGPPETALTGADGKALVKYPVESIPDEKEYTGKLILAVSHPDYAPFLSQGYPVDEAGTPIRLTRGIPLSVSGYYGSDHQPVTELVAFLNQELIEQSDWRKTDGGGLTLHKLSPGGHIVRLMGRLPSGEIVFSDSEAFTAETGKNYNFNLDLKPGIRLEGRLDDKVPRPVKNGRVIISVRPTEIPAWNNYADVDATLKKYPSVEPWRSYRAIAEDGTFVFESVPPGGLDVVVHGDGFVSQSGGDFQQRNGSRLVKVPGFALPQPFDLSAPVTKIEVATEPGATLELIARDEKGNPVAGATVHVNPNVVRMGGIFGDPRGASDEAPFRVVPRLPAIAYSATTDKSGVAIIPNIPATDRGVNVFHPRYQVPLQPPPHGMRDRYLRTSFSPGATNKLEVTLEAKGEDYIGKN